MAKTKHRRHGKLRHRMDRKVVEGIASSPEMRALFYTGAMISERAHELYGDREWTDEELKQVVAQLEEELDIPSDPG